MTQAPSKWLQRLRERLPEQPLVLVPAHCFFTHSFEVATGLSEDERENYLALALEGGSPFPVEQLAWGYLHEPGETRALVYATLRSRVGSIGEFDLSACYHLFPGFISRLCVSPPAQPTVRFLAQGGAVSALFLQPGSRIPERIVSRRVEAEVLTDEALLASRDALAKSLHADDFIEENGLWVGAGHHLDKAGRPVFAHRHLGPTTEEETLPLDLPVAQLWAADLRDEAFARKERKERRLARRLWWGAKGLAALLVLLLILQGGLWGLRKGTSVTQERVLARNTIVEQVDQKEDFIERLALDSAQSVDPVLMLSLINDVRPDTIYFNEARADQIDHLTFSGESRTGVNAVNNYAEVLRDLPAVAAVSQNSEIRDGRTLFEMAVTFDRADLASASVARYEDVAGSGEETP